MGTRQLRQHYDKVERYLVDPGLGDILEPWRRHRERFLATLQTFDEDQWLAPTHCTDWNARDVISHLVTVDQFFTASLLGAQAGTPTEMLPGFDPKAIPELLVAPMRAKSSRELLDDFAAGQEVYVRTVEGLAPEDWAAWGEAPFGLVPVRLVMAHAFWDSWVHERDILVPQGQEPALEPDEAFLAAWYSLFFGCVQGGQVGDADGPESSIVADVVFAETPERSIRLRVGDRVRFDAANASSAGEAATVVPAVAFVDAFTQRGGATLDTFGQLPADLGAQLARGQQTF
jgi:uncharacterized protein (TIGR03083 family)